MKITFFEARENEKALLAALLPSHSLSFFKEKLKPETLAQAVGADIVSVFVNSEVKKEMIDALPKMKLLITRSAGFDHIDLVSAKEKGVLVSNVPAYGAHTVAEFAFALILNLSRNICAASNQMRMTGDYNILPFQGFDLCGKTLGIVGTGRIGKNTALIAKGFGLKIIATDIFPDQAFAEENGFEYVPLSVLLSNSDIISLHAPYNETTHHLINKENIKLIKKGALFINTARGELIDTEALVKALKNGQISGAGLDVLEGERKLKEEAEFLDGGKGDANDFKLLTEDHMLLDMPNVIVTPHIAFFSCEAEEDISKTTAKNILSFIEGKPENLVK
jgi:D-lactate dehydrogenase